MDPLAGLDEDEHADFFRHYEAEQESQSLAAFEADEAEPLPSPEQLAHFTRFQKPVAWFLSAMALLSLAGLALRRSEPAQSTLVASGSHPRRPSGKLVASYGAATAAESVARSAPPAPYVPVVWVGLSPAPSMCVLDASADTAWLTVALGEPANIEGNAGRLSQASYARGRRPTHTSNLGAHVTASAHFVPSARVVSATPVATPAVTAPAVTAPTQPPFRSVARFPDPR